MSQDGGGAYPRLTTTRWWTVLGAITVLQMLIRWWSVLGLDHFHDDLLITYRALDRPLDREFLFDMYAGHWGPLARAIEWATVNSAPFSTGVAYGVVLVWLLVADAGMIMALRRMFGMRLTPLLVYATWALSPVIATSVMLWSLGLVVVPMLALMAWTTYFHVGATMAPTRAATVAASVSLLLLLLVDPQAVIFLPFIVLLTAAYPGWGREGVRGRGGLVGTFRESANVWAGYGIVGLLYVGTYLLSSPQRVTQDASTGGILTVLREAILGVAFPSLLGGAWTSDAGSLPSSGELSTGAVTLVALVVAVLVGTTIAMRSQAWRAWAVLALLVLMQSAILTVAVSFQEIGALLRQTRYLVPLLVPAFILIGAAVGFGPLRAWYAALLARPRDRQRATVVAVGLVVVYASSAWVTNVRVAEQAKVASTATFWRNVRADLAANPEASIVDRTMPAHVLFAAFLPELGKASSSLRHFVTGQSWNTPSPDPQLLTDAGRLVPAVVAPYITSRPGPEDCGYLLEESAWGTVPLPESAFNLGWGLRMEYVASEPVQVRARTGSGPTILPLAAGDGEITWVSGGVIDEVEMRLVGPSGARVCVGSITVGGLVPSSG